MEIIDPRFLRYWSQSQDFRNQLAGLSASTDMAPYLSLIDQKRLKIVLPSVREQRAVGRILGALDEKIELNRRMNKTLDPMTRALFKSWFVDFDPVRAKAEGRDPGLPQPIADLFPDSFEESEFGEIPKAWSAAPVYEIATYINGGAYAAFRPNGERRGLPIIKIAELKAGVTGETKFSNVQMPEKYRITKGDILFSWSGNPDTSIDTFVWSHGPAWLNQHIFRVLPHHEHERAFVLSTLKALRPVFAEIARNKQTTGLGHVTAEDMKRLFVSKPGDRVMRAWDVVAAPLHGRAFQNDLETRSLSMLRDALQPKLMSGELRVKDIEGRS
jgi:type I restriction enzyme S subunit